MRLQIEGSMPRSLILGLLRCFRKQTLVHIPGIQRPSISVPRKWYALMNSDDSPRTEIDLMVLPGTFLEVPMRLFNLLF
ncbi:hypothetical protein JTE90_028138 [Oedothorax gibbosus]|uniref:Uncharacterized protein n=1 Tax=Oedothorax gibbosus TaxID=931172 RepID=A0AAV6V8G5_9ARAC|nr:hypothetical protein JTE90_028138 [Oedothorax gibbosus]